MDKGYLEEVLLKTVSKISEDTINSYKEKYGCTNGIYMCGLCERNEMDTELALYILKNCNASCIENIIDSKYIGEELKKYKDTVMHMKDKDIDLLTKIMGRLWRPGENNIGGCHEGFEDLMRALSEQEVITTTQLATIYDVINKIFNFNTSFNTDLFKLTYGRINASHTISEQDILDGIDTLKFINPYMKKIFNSYSNWRYRKRDIDPNEFNRVIDECSRKWKKYCINNSTKESFLKDSENRVIHYLNDDSKMGPNKFWEINFPGVDYKLDKSSVKDNNPELYNQLISKTENFANMVYVIRLNEYKEAFEKLQEVYETNFREITMYDFIRITGITDIVEANKFVTGAVIKNKDLRPLRNLLARLLKQCKFAKKDEILSSKHIYKDAEVPNETKLMVMQYMKDNHYPLYIALYNTVMSKYLSGELKIS